MVREWQGLNQKLTKEQNAILQRILQKTVFLEKPKPFHFERVETIVLKGCYVDANTNRKHRFAVSM